MFDWKALDDSEEQSLWLFMKWVAIDGIFLFGLPRLRIPWLEWSASTMMLLFFSHAVADGMLMFRIPIPLTAGLAAIGRSLFGAYELAVNEHNVNPEAVKVNDSLILGRHVIHILPEGSAILNPGRAPFCIGDTVTEARLPIWINSTKPISMDLLRTDLDTQANETIHISKSQIKTMHKEASRLLSYSDKPNEPKTLYYSVKKPGLYVLAKVMDESNLEVARKRLAHTVIVPCPKAKITSLGSDRCTGELSNVELEVTGTPPLTLSYRKTVNQNPQEATFENILPDDFSSPLARREQSAVVVPNKVDTAWAKSHTITVPLRESLGTSGRWLYAIEKVKDAFGNNVSYVDRDHEDRKRHLAKSSDLQQAITVHERPTVNLQGCNPQHPLKVAQGRSAHLPVQYGSTGKGELANMTYHLDYLFSRQADAPATGGHMSAAKPRKFTAKDRKQLPPIQEAGLYTITGVSSDFCQGEVLEPASCILQNPPRPQLSLKKEEIFDKCAGSPIGLRVDLDLIGTPPFDIHFRMTRSSDRIQTDEHEIISGLRGQIELTPNQAGTYKYEFLHISDTVYKNQEVKDISLSQHVKPSASAKFIDAGRGKISCLEDVVSFDVALQGIEPFALEYELVHGGKRAKYNLEKVESKTIQITTDPLKDGGDYTLALASVKDGNGCREFLKDEARISVRQQKPKVAFRNVDGRRSIRALEGEEVQLPLRLEGDPPWIVKYLDKRGHEQTIQAKNANDRVTAGEEGTYTLTDVKDGTCPGIVDETAKDFEISCIPQPDLRIPPSENMERKDNSLVRADVCEGDEDVVEVLFKGSAPYLAHYTQHFKPEKGTKSPENKELRTVVNVAALRMDTRQAGLYEYKFSTLEDANYNHASKRSTPVTVNVQQKVNAKPSAAFTKPGTTYSYCSVEADGEEVIPVTLHGVPPFDLEVEIKHHGTARPETVSLTGITGNSHNIRIPHSRLHLGKSAVYLRRVSDSRGCARALDSTAEERVQISVHDAPTITPLESHSDFCVGDRINFGLSGVAPFSVFYTFEGAARKAVASSTTFRRLAEKPGTFVVTGISDGASTCKASTNLTTHIHGLPSVRVSKGRDSYVDIHEGSSTDIQFDFGGTPPFEFTYTRSSNTEKNGKKAGVILDMHSEVSEGYSMRIEASEEGTYEVVSIKDRYCAYAKLGIKLNQKEAQKRLTY